MQLDGSTEGWFTCSKCPKEAKLEDAKDLLCYEHGKERLLRGLPDEKVKT